MESCCPFGSTFARPRYLFFGILQHELWNFCQNLTLSTFGPDWKVLHVPVPPVLNKYNILLTELTLSQDQITGVKKQLVKMDFSPTRAHSHWLAQGHMASNNKPISLKGQHYKMYDVIKHQDSLLPSVPVLCIRS